MNPNVTIRHTASAGVLITIGRNSIGVDAFSRDPNRLYPDTSDSVKTELWEVIERGSIRTLLFTHAHGDHFCLADTLEALERYPELTIISTEEAIGQLQKAASGRGHLYAGIWEKCMQKCRISPACLRWRERSLCFRATHGLRRNCLHGSGHGHGNRMC